MPEQGRHFRDILAGTEQGGFFGDLGLQQLAYFFEIACVGAAKPLRQRFGDPPLRVHPCSRSLAYGQEPGVGQDPYRIADGASASAKLRHEHEQRW